MNARRGVTILLASLCGSGIAQGQLGDAKIWRITDTSRIVDLSIASSGGVSIGAYQAGASWMIAELLKFLRDHPEQRARFKLPTYRVSALSGASAGNVNALLTALQSCEAAAARPAEASALWDLWMQVGVDQLLPRRNGDPSLELGLLDRAYFNTVLKDRLRDELAKEPAPDCYVPIVTTMSKLVPSSLALNRLMSASVQRYVTSYSVASERDVDSGKLPPGPRPTRQARHGARQADLAGHYRHDGELLRAGTGLRAAEGLVLRGVPLRPNRTRVLRCNRNRAGWPMRAGAGQQRDRRPRAIRRWGSDRQCAAVCRHPVDGTA